MKVADKERKIGVMLVYWQTAEMIYVSWRLTKIIDINFLFTRLFFLSITIVQFWDWGGLGGRGTMPFYFILLLY